MSRTTAHRAFRRTMNLIAGGKPLALALKAIVQAVEAEDPEILCSILLLDSERRRLVLGAAPSLPDFYNEAVEGVEIGPSVGSCGTAAYLGRRVTVDDIQSSPLWTDFRELAAEAGLASCWSEPIRALDGAVVGTFAIYHRQVSTPNKEDIAFIEAAAQLAAIAIDRRRAEEELAASELRARLSAEQAMETARNLSSFFDVSADLLCIRDMEGRFVKVNQAWETVLGHPVEVLEGSGLLPLLHADDLESTRANMQRAEADGEVNGFVNRYRRADGTYCQLEWRARRCGDLVFGVARDVTERLRIEAEMAEARRAAETANKAKNDFLANMSHEIRTPLNGVIGIAAALGETALTPRQAEMVDLIRRSGETLERLVSDILDVSKIEAGQMTIQTQAFDLDGVLDGLLDVTRLRAKEKGVGVRVERGPSVSGGFLGDSVRIGQVLSNLMSNAVKFTDRGEVTVRIDVEDRDDGQASLLCVEVEDTGVGFDAAKGEMIFQRFSQADSTITRRFGGSGLGLSISRTLVEMMGGAITARSKPGSGSLFRVVLPLHRTEAEAAVDADPIAPGVQAEGLRVLLAEDHPINQRVVQLILEPCGAAVTVVENGAQAVEAMAASPYDVVLMDMQMPIMDGLAATRAIRAHEGGGRRTPIIMLSANAMAGHRQDALAAGADLHVAKPITVATLLDGISQVITVDARRAG
ncbi:hybrid sensor histidine kinase/response regulator [Caulobacter segnis]|uniref:histidine kinase n=2 Tax=Caulobacter segnis TaxID=88688 RepID=D5VIG5_CAUST|nr:ATP-binding protein [Caulobacter segnis]ADG09539.1 multi-sensor hybrid histidine kinase [Caulobacter segnis ATCC 21756]AVQ01325.1 hybrid sensor histidine kinase/response regulator [Caulobacter segnis]